MSNEEVFHNSDAAAFSLTCEGRESKLTYKLEDKLMDIQHTFVHPDDRGKGVAKELVLAALQHAKAHQLHVRPSCSYVEQFLRRNPEWEFLRR